MLPSETLKPAKSMIASLGIGMQALSAVISTNTPGSPRASMTLVAASTIGFKMSASTSGASCECVPGWASSGGRQARTQGAAFAGGKGKPEDAAWRSSGAARPGAYSRESPPVTVEAIGVDLGGTKMLVGVADAERNVSYRASAPSMGLG